eukprot:gene2169-1338_t
MGLAELSLPYSYAGGCSGYDSRADNLAEEEKEKVYLDREKVRVCVRVGVCEKNNIIIKLNCDLSKAKQDKRNAAGVRVK